MVKPRLHISQYVKANGIDGHADKACLIIVFK